MIESFPMQASSLKTKLPPLAKTRPHRISLHSKSWDDPYFWLREREDPEVIHYLNEENAYVNELMKPTQELQEKLYQEILSRIKETDLSVPVRMGNFEYYSRTEAGKQYAILCRKKLEPNAAEEILLDQNELAKNQPYFSLGIYEISPDHHALAYATDLKGAETYDLVIMDLKTHKLLPDSISNCAPNAVWAEDNQTLFYTMQDAAKRPYRLWRHKIGTSSDQDVLIYEEKDEAFNLSIQKSKSHAFLFMEIHSKSSSEIYFLDAHQPQNAFTLIAKRRPKIEYSVAHHGNQFLIVTNEEAVNFKLMTAPITDPRLENWKEVLAHRPEVKLEGIETFQNFLIFYERDQGLSRIRIQDIVSQEFHAIEFPETAYTLWGGSNPEFQSEVFRFGYTSLVSPSSIFDYHMRTRTRELKKQTEVLGGYDPSKYQTHRTSAVSHDGTRVPISIVYRKDLFQNGENPALLVGYGSYGICYDPEFSSTRISLLDRGWVYAIAHIRGGGDLGRPWYDDGKLLKKKNTFQDFIACAEHLVQARWAHPKKISISGGSAGGLLVGNVLNERPELFRSAIAKVPFVDIVNTMLDRSLPLTVGEFDEWGNPEEKKFFDYIFSYSPYDQVKAQVYPHLLITAGLNDPRVQYWEPAKWAAKLRYFKKDPHFLFLKTKMDSGHGGPSGRYEALREIAFDYAFLFLCLETRD